jgi:predicted glutamine amidotransferase
LFGLSGGRRPLQATFWLLEAPDSLAVQSRRNPDGYGIATFDPDGTPELDKRAVAAYADEEFAYEAREESSTTFVAHVRYATVGGLKEVNTHPFEQNGRVFAHNGHIDGLPRLERELGPYMRLVKGDTDSERVFALITRELERHDDPNEAIAAAVRWCAANLEVRALNFLLATPTDMWALRYPETHELLMLERAAGGASGARQLDHASATGRVRVRSGELAERAAVVFATERMDEDAGWRPLEPGELVHVDADLRVTTRDVTPP